jgi:hypothetical protein
MMTPNMANKRETEDSNGSKTWGCGRFLLMSAIIAMSCLFLLVAGVFLAYRAREASGRALVAEELAKLSAKSLPVDSATLNLWYRANTSEEDTSEWLAILDYLKSSDFQSISKGISLFDPKLTEDTSPNETSWPSENRYRELYQATEKQREKIHALCSRVKPVRFPLVFDGINTLLTPLQDSRNVPRLLTAEFEVAMADKNSALVRRSLVSQLGFSTILSNQPCLVSELVRIACRGAALENLKRAIESDALDEEDLKLVHDSLVNSLTAAGAWATCIQTERAIGLGAFDDLGNVNIGRSSFKGIAASSHDKLRYIRMMEVAEKVAFDSADRAKAALTRIQDELNNDVKEDGWLAMREKIVSSLSVPALNAIGTAAIRDATLHHQCEVAIRIRQFQKTKGRFPKSIAELQTTILGGDMFIPLGGRPFGYQVLLDRCLLWGPVDRVHGAAAHAGDDPPTVTDEDNEREKEAVRRAMFNIRQ